MTKNRQSYKVNCKAAVLITTKTILIQKCISKNSDNNNQETKFSFNNKMNIHVLKTYLFTKA